MFFFSSNKKNNKEAQKKNDQSSHNHLPSMLEPILVVVDGSNASKTAVAYAIDLASEIKVNLIAIYVVDTETMDYLKNMRILADSERVLFEQQLETSGQHMLTKIKQLAEAKKISIKTYLSRGVFHKEVLRYAEEEHASAIIVGGWKRTITRKDKPSVERQLILDEAACPVFIIKEKNQPSHKN